MSTQQKTILHGTAVALQGKDFGPSAVLLRGPSGSGKSDLAFRLIEGGGALICDDQVVLERRHDKVVAAAAEAIRGLIEVRGLGLLKYPTASPAPLQLVIDLVERKDVPRMPVWEEVDILGVVIKCLKLHAFDASAAFKVAKAIELVHKPALLV